MAKPKLWTYLVGGALVLALGSAAFGADTTDSNQDSSVPAALGNASSATLPDQASAVASAVLGALTGGSNPSTIASKGKATSEQTTTNTEPNTETTTNVSSGQESNQAGTTGTKPGWGCGDTNHTHSGPPGRPGATPPPGCAKANK
jgi:hypothetical protein